MAKNSEVSEAILLAAASAMSYAVAFAYRSGYWSHFGLPPLLLSPSLGVVLQAAGVVGLVALFFWNIANGVWPFQADQVYCMICGKGGMKTLSRHLNQVHGITPREYRKQFNIPATQSLTAKNFSESRRQTALDRGLADNLAKARAVRAEKLQAKKPAVKKVAKKKG